MLAHNEGEAGRKLHILEIAGNAITGGMEKYVFNLVEHLPSQNFKVTCMTPYESAFTAGLRNLGSEVFITPMDTDPPWRSIQFVTELIQHLKVDLIHAHLPRAHVLAGLVGRLTGVPVVATVHGMDITSQELGISRTTGTHLTVVCQEAYSQALALGLMPERLSLIPNGVDTQKYLPHQSGVGFRKKIKIPLSARLVGFVGRISWEKGPDQFMSVAEAVHQEMPGVHFALVGEGPMETEIREKITKLGLEHTIHMAGLWRNVWEVYPALDILAQTSRVEGMPFALLEGMSCGKPIVAMGVGGVTEIVEVGTTGLLSASGDWLGLANALLKLLKEPEQLKSMGVAARERAVERFDLETSIQRMANLFRHLAGSNLPEKRLSQSDLGQDSWPAANQSQELVPVDPGKVFPRALK